MDLYCPKCGEPWDVDCLHEVDGMTFSQAWAAFRKRGCAVFGERCAKTPDNHKALLARTAYNVLGDDVDGAAAMLDEADYFGL